MLLNNVTTQGQTVTLGQGIYQVNLFNLETIDPYDYIAESPAGDGQTFPVSYGRGFTDGLDSQR